MEDRKMDNRKMGNNRIDNSQLEALIDKFEKDWTNENFLKVLEQLVR